MAEISSPVVSVYTVMNLKPGITPQEKEVVIQNATALVERVKNETGVLQYSLTQDEDPSKMNWLEIFENEAAAVHHIQSLLGPNKDFTIAMFSMADQAKPFQVHIRGPVSDAGRLIISNLFAPSYEKYIAGFVRQ
jgi:quinol monooxygenase YgiN